jgi:hypothetical protein
MFKTHKLIKGTLRGLKKDFAWIEVKCTNKNEIIQVTSHL